MRALPLGLALLLALVAVQTKAASVRGVDPAVSDRYKPVGGKFGCLDGGKAIPASQVNDGYCDCVDGTDEPGAFVCCMNVKASSRCCRQFEDAAPRPTAGTPACPNGSFYCKNLLFQPLRLNSSFVNDGVCGE
jgi:protein kinase C substrate 80K-H